MFRKFVTVCGASLSYSVTLMTPCDVLKLTTVPLVVSGSIKLLLRSRKTVAPLPTAWFFRAVALSRLNPAAVPAPGVGWLCRGEAPDEAKKSARETDEKARPGTVK